MADSPTLRDQTPRGPSRATNVSSTRARTFERVVFADFWRSDSGRLCAARRWIRLCKPFAFRPASMCPVAG
jgi:hypothetical protein